MAAPNVRGATGTINGKTARAALTTTLTAVLLTCPSGHLYKVNTVQCANIDGVNAVDVTLAHYDGATDVLLASVVTVAAKAVKPLLVGPVYLEEGQSLRGGASANGDAVVVISYEDIF